MSATPRFGLPHIVAGQAQKEVTHNEALELIDCLLTAAVVEAPRDDPPSEPIVGNAYIVGLNGSGDWQGRGESIATYTEGGWRFIEPVEGLQTLVRSTGETALFRDGAWEIGIARCQGVHVDGNHVVGARAAAVADAAGGAVVDAEARTAIAAMLGVLRGHGLIAT